MRTAAPRRHQYEAIQTSCPVCVLQLPVAGLISSSSSRTSAAAASWAGRRRSRSRGQGRQPPNHNSSTTRAREAPYLEQALEWLASEEFQLARTWVAGSECLRVAHTAQCNAACVENRSLIDKVPDMKIAPQYIINNNYFQCTGLSESGIVGRFAVSSEWCFCADFSSWTTRLRKSRETL